MRCEDDDVMLTSMETARVISIDITINISKWNDKIRAILLFFINTFHGYMKIHNRYFLISVYQPTAIILSQIGANINVTIEYCC